MLEPNGAPGTAGELQTTADVLIHGRFYRRHVPALALEGAKLRMSADTGYAGNHVHAGAAVLTDEAVLLKRIVKAHGL